VLVEGLPQASLFRTRLRDEVEIEVSADAEPKYGPWSTLNYQLADLADLVRDLTQAVYEAPAGEVSKTRPDPVPRPQPKIRKVTEASSAFEAIEALNEIRRQHREQRGE